MTNNNSIRSLASQTMVYGLGSVLPRILNYILLTPFYTRVLTQISDYGTHSYLYSYSAFIITLLTFGMETTFFRYAKSNGLKHVYSTSLYFLVFNTLLLIAFIFANTGYICTSIGINREDYLWYFAGIIGLDVICAIPYATLRFLEKAKLFALFKIINVLVNIGVNLFYFWLVPFLKQRTSIDFSAIYSEQNLLEYSFRANLIANGLTFVMLVPQAKKYLVRFQFKLFWDMVKYSTPILISGLMGMINEVSDKILLKFLIPAEKNPIEQIGIYSANYKIAALMTIFTQMFRFGAEPFIFKIAATHDSKEKYKKIIKYFLYIGLFIFLAVVLYIDIFKYLISNRYHEGLSIVPIVLIANLFFGLYYTISFWYKITDKTRFAAYFSFIGAAITLIFNVILIPILGYSGAAYTTLICYVSMFFMSFVAGQKYYKIDYEIKKMISVFVIAIAIYIISQFNVFNNLWYKIAFNTVLLLSYIVFVFNIDDELRKFRKIK